MLRSSRDRHVMLRKIYHPFTLKQIKFFLRDLHVRYVHLKLDRSSHILSIGMKKLELVPLYFDRLLGSLFDQEHYRRYRRQDRRSSK